MKIVSLQIINEKNKHLWVIIDHINDIIYELIKV